MQISSALAADQPAYRAAPDGAGFAMSNPAQHLTARFGDASVQVSAASLSLKLRLRELSAGDKHEAIGPVTPTASADRVDYSYPQLSQWYRNGPAGLEQGFVVPRALPGAGAGPLTLTLGLEGNVRAALSGDAQSVTLNKGSLALLYGGLVATDASGRTLRSWLALQHGELMLRVDAGQARYPLTIDPNLTREQQGPKLTTGEAEEARFGSSVALSSDGSTLAVGGPKGGGAQGAVWIFTRSGSSWIKQAVLTSGETTTSPVEECAEEAAEEAGECFFGSSVALSADGNTALVGDPSPGPTPGAAWVFTRTGTSWTRRQSLTGGAAPGDGHFGRSVALSAEGTTALVGDPLTGTLHGSALVFVSSGGSFTKQETLTDAEASKFARFGRSVALSADGSTALIGGPGALGESGAAGTGAAWTFTRSGSAWSQLSGALTGGGAEEGQRFGRAVALSGDGNIALVGAPTGKTGDAWSFARSSGGFTQPGIELKPPAEFGASQYGSSVTLSGDGSTALVGAPRAENGLGAVVELVRSGSSWTTQPELLEGKDAVGKGAAGTSVALSGDGGLAAFGAPHDNRRSGAAWVFGLVAAAQVPPPTVTGVLPGHGPTSGGTAVEIKGENLNNATVVSFGTTTATPTSVSAATVKVLAPAEPAGRVDVTVTTPVGTSQISRPGDYYVYEGPSVPSSTSSTSSSAAATGTPQGASGVLGTTQAAGPSQAAGVACRVSLRSKHIVVGRHSTAMVRLLRTGTGLCRGTLTLRYRQKGHGRHFKLRTIGSVRFSIAPGKSQVVKIKLNRLGRSLFVARHGKLGASAALVRTTPAPAQAKTASVSLSIKKKPKAHPAHP